jgi:hypothetical protein
VFFPHRAFDGQAMASAFVSLFAFTGSKRGDIPVASSSFRSVVSLPPMSTFIGSRHVEAVFNTADHPAYISSKVCTELGLPCCGHNTTCLQSHASITTSLSDVNDIRASSERLKDLILKNQHSCVAIHLSFC